MVLALLLTFTFIGAVVNGDGINRQSIVYHDETPNVFYCPQVKPVSLEGTVVKAKPLEHLCEYEGRGVKEGARSDCWNDVDETEFACAEKKRILTQQKPPGSENGADLNDNLIPKNRRGDYKLRKIDATGTKFEDADQDNHLLREALRQAEERRNRKANHEFKK